MTADTHIQPNYIWKDADGKNISMREMDPKHLQYAHTHACGQEFKYHNLSGFFSDKRDQLEEVAAERGIELIFPDEKHPSPKWGTYFCNIRKTKKVTLTKSPLLSTYVGLEKVNILD
jgi:hypothetical protein